MADPTYPRPGFRIIEGTRDKVVAISMTTKDWLEVMVLIGDAHDTHMVYARNYSRSVGEYHYNRANLADCLMDAINEGLSQ